jgi:hypothetical protein
MEFDGYFHDAKRQGYVRYELDLEVAKRIIGDLREEGYSVSLQKVISFEDVSRLLVENIRDSLGKDFGLKFNGTRGGLELVSQDVSETPTEILNLKPRYIFFSDSPEDLDNPPVLCAITPNKKNHDFWIINGLVPVFYQQLYSPIYKLTGRLPTFNTRRRLNSS